MHGRDVLCQIDANGYDGQRLPLPANDWVDEISHFPPWQLDAVPRKCADHPGPGIAPPSRGSAFGKPLASNVGCCIPDAAGSDEYPVDFLAMNYFESPFKGQLLSEHVKNPNIQVGRYSYYSGYYHGHPFDECARYLMPDREDVDKLIIGSFCSIGSGASFIMAGNQGHRYDWASSFPFFYMQEEPAFSRSLDAFRKAGDTVIGNDVWIGSEAMVMPGITIGHGAVVGSRSLVTKDVAPYAIIGGNPAQQIKKRFSEEEISWLLEMAWWDWPLDKIKTAMPMLCSSDIAGLYRYWRESRSMSDR